MTAATQPPPEEAHEPGCWRKPGHERCALRAAMRLHQHRAQHADRQARHLAAIAKESSQLTIQFRGGAVGDPSLSLIEQARDTLEAEAAASENTDRRRKRLAVVKDPAAPRPLRRPGGRSGFAHPRAKLTFEQVQDIRRRWVPNDSTVRDALMAEFEISRTGIYKLVACETRVSS